MTFQVGLADALRAEGLHVVEVNGWQTRGRPEAEGAFHPHGSVNHHTAGAQTGNAPSLGIVVNGRADLAGPLCNVLQARDDTCYVVAAGRANHAGPGGWAGLSGNASVFGLEVEHVGTEAEEFPASRRATSLHIHAAFAKLGQFDASKTCQHFEWNPGGKIDFLRALLGDPAIFRAELGALLNPQSAPPALQEQELLMGIAKDDNDARRAWCRRQVIDLWGREPTGPELDILTYSCGANGADAALAAIADHANAAAFRQKRGW